DVARGRAAAVRVDPLDALLVARHVRHGDRATGERGPQEPRDGNVVPEASPEDAFQVMHVRERTKPLQDRHMDAAKLADFAEVVPLQVDDHYVLRGVLLAGEEFL